MLQLRARSWALRDGFADVLKGLASAEEQRDVAIAEVIEDDAPRERDTLKARVKRRLLPQDEVPNVAEGANPVDVLESHPLSDAAPPSATPESEAVG